MSGGSLAAMAVVLAFVAGCGAAADPAAVQAPVAAGADSPSPTPTRSPVASPSAAPSAHVGDPAVAKFCTAVVAVDTASASGADGNVAGLLPSDDGARRAFAASYLPVLERMEEAAPPAVATDAATFVRLMRAAASGEDSALASPELARADSGVDAYLLERCGYPEVSLYAVEYEFDRVPDSVPAGPTAISLTNDGQELHQVVLLRVEEGVDETMDALFELPEEDRAGKVTPVAEVDVRPGRTNTALVDLEPGRYILVCYVPKDSKGGVLGHGEPHFADGMLTELTVT